jgi:hypothetical protein
MCLKKESYPSWEICNSSASQGAGTEIVKQFDLSRNNNIIQRGGKMKISNETICFSTLNQFQIIEPNKRRFSQ